MKFEKVCDIKDNQLVIDLPEKFRGKDKVLVTIDDEYYADSGKEKLELLKQASKDPLFLEDIMEISEDFKHIDYESL